MKLPGTITPTTNQRKFASGIPVIDMPTTGGPPSDPMQRGDYDGKELQPNPGITPDRFAAYLLPSLVNGVRVPSVHARQAGVAGVAA